MSGGRRRGAKALSTNCRPVRPPSDHVADRCAVTTTPEPSQSMSRERSTREDFHLGGAMLRPEVRPASRPRLGRPAHVTKCAFGHRPAPHHRSPPFLPFIGATTTTLSATLSAPRGVAGHTSRVRFSRRRCWPAPRTHADRAQQRAVARRCPVRSTILSARPASRTRGATQVRSRCVPDLVQPLTWAYRGRGELAMPVEDPAGL